MSLVAKRKSKPSKAAADQAPAQEPKPEPQPEPTEAGEGGRQTRPVQIDRELVRMIRVVCSHDEITANDFLEPVLTQYVRTHYERVQKAMGLDVQRMREDDQK